MVKKIKQKRKVVITLAVIACLIIGIYAFYKIMHHKAIGTDIQSEKQDTKKDTGKEGNGSQDKNREEKSETYILLSSVGDCTLGHDDKFGYENSLPAALKKNNNDYSYFFKNVADIFKNDDITTANLETTFTDSTVKAEKQFTFKAHKEYAKALPLGHIEAVSVSNNHIYDYLTRGFKDTISALEDEGVNYFGEGYKWITEANGNKIGFLGYRAFSDDDDFLKKMKADIEELKSKGYVVVINVHWGEENSYYPNNVQKHVAHYAIDQGADLILGHHPHVVQGIEKYKNRFIAYSLGNFAFGGNMNPKDKDTYILQSKFIFKNHKLSSYGIKVIPCSISSVNYINDYCPTPLIGDRKKNVTDKLNKLSNNLEFNLGDEFVFFDITSQ